MIVKVVEDHWIGERKSIEEKDENGQNVVNYYVVMEDLTNGLEGPSILDLKIGYLIFF